MYESSALKLDVGPVPEEAPVTRGYRMKLDMRRSYHPKAMRVCETDSYPEEQHLAYCAGHPNIIAYCSRPGPAINDYVGDVKLEYKPDAWIRWDTGLEERVEFKPKVDLVESSDGVLEPERWPLVRRWHADAGLQCRFVTDELLEEHAVFIQNWMELLPWVNLAIRDSIVDVVERVEGLFQSRERPMSLEEVESHLADVPSVWATAATAYLLHQHRLKADLHDVHVSRSLVVSRP